MTAPRVSIGIFLRNCAQLLVTRDLSRSGLRLVRGDAALDRLDSLIIGFDAMRSGFTLAVMHCWKSESASTIFKAIPRVHRQERGVGAFAAAPSGESSRWHVALCGKTLLTNTLDGSWLHKTGGDLKNIYTLST
mmetsp:Transcript_57760/g.135339  ORF Transcript_57760/g.135339 Transcript_57760/m.135339 type:complete len:134 (-) Transcript_57760:57-458(-)